MKISAEREREFIALRRELHKYPELGLEEYKTSKLIAEYLQDLGIEVTTGIAKTGVVGLIQGKSGSKTLLIRADIDALPITETAEIEFKSQNAGVMHACGHDFHTAILLGTAKELFSVRDSFKGNIKLIFQPAEESFGGAEQMIKEGVMNSPEVDAAVCYHVAPLPVGTVELQSGAVTAAPDYFQIHIKGRGGHGSAPEDCINPVVIAAAITNRLGEIKAGKADTPFVVSVCSIAGGTCENVIPDTATIKGTSRSTDKETRRYLYETIKSICEEEAGREGAAASVDYNFRYPIVINDEGLTSDFAETAGALLGQENVVKPQKISMVGDDFSYFSELVPSCYARLGVGESNLLHTPNFNPDERAIAIGVDIMTDFALSFLQRSESDDRIR
ncbi:MAG: amidohydrolase [Ruminococcus sp.]|jgi:amidohydrolase|nr:amidohydrolase [Ruminococcus sp.]